MRLFEAEKQGVMVQEEKSELLGSENLSVKILVMLAMY